MSVIVPARDEEGAIGALLASVVPHLDPLVGDEVIVVDDHSADATAAIAAAHGARVVPAPVLAPGWAGKPNAAAAGAAVAAHDVLVFLDADVVLGPSTLTRLVAAVEAHPEEIISVQPWHRAVRPHEQLSLLFNLAALMGAGAFTPLGDRVATHVAFGPVLAMRAELYQRIGGHGHPDVRATVLEDIALARRVRRTRLAIGSPDTASFRMYPQGAGQLVEGWTKSIAIGLDASPWWAALGTAAWVASLSGGWAVAWWCVVASVVQLFVLARRAGSFRWWAVVAFPVPLACFVAVLLRSVWRRWRRRAVSWKGRELVPDQDTG